MTTSNRPRRKPAGRPAYPYFRLGFEKAGSSVSAERIPTVRPRAAPHPSGDKRQTTKYLPSQELSHAVNVALVLGMPLLLTGPPGTGKTELASAIGNELGCPVHKLETKSTSHARDLFYTYDSINAFKAVGEHDTRDFITYQALGRAILEAFPSDRKELAILLSPDELAAHEGPRRSVVLIDEIDKAPRDFPNDLLNEIERLYFRVPELRNATSPVRDGHGAIDPRYRPIVVITSNEERGLPPPFMRRCVFFDIPFPTEAEMRDIVLLHLRDSDFPAPAITDAVRLFYDLRAWLGDPDDGPSTAELLSFLQMLAHRGLEAGVPLDKQRPLLRQSFCVLLKGQEYRDQGLAFLDQWPERS